MIFFQNKKHEQDKLINIDATNVELGFQVHAPNKSRARRFSEKRLIPAEIYARKVTLAEN